MSQILLGLLAETFIHPGAGQTAGTIDLPVAREAATSYPFIPGSSLKGALRDAARTEMGTNERGANELDRVFGQQDRAGVLLVSDARLLLLPVRSLTGSYRWVTCPHLLERLARDRRRAGTGTGPTELPRVDENCYLGALDVSEAEWLYLEERSFAAMPTGDDGADGLRGWVEVLVGLIEDSAARERLSSQLVVLSNHDFVWFARNGLAVQARNKLDDNKNSQNLWYEETLPPDTVMYAVLSERESSIGDLSAVDFAANIFESRPYLQVGGNETVGQGWFAIAMEGV